MEEQEILKNQCPTVMKTSSGPAKTPHLQISLNSQQAQELCCLKTDLFPYVHHNPSVWCNVLSLCYAVSSSGYKYTRYQIDTHTQ